VKTERRVKLFDAHFHVIDPAFPLVANQGFLPPAFRVEDYRHAVSALEVVGGAVVSASFQGFDQEYLRAALRELGAGFVGVTQLPPDTPDDAILELDAAGVRGVRFNLFRGMAEDFDRLERFARRIHALAGWHVELYADAATLEPVAPRLAALPSVVIDHLGLTARGLPVLEWLVERGVRVKATGFGRLDFEPADVLRRLDEIDPHALVFGTDLPSTRAPRPFTPADVELVVQALGERRARAVLVENALRLYRLSMRDA
jgi:Predicted metal-dependent hydrolase of the TIM-barrel fold